MTSEIHHYGLVVTLKNVGTKRLDDWEIAVELPTPLLEPHVVVGHQVREQSNAETSLFRVGSDTLKRRLRPGEHCPVTFEHRADSTIFSRRFELFEKTVKARASIDGQIVITAEKPVGDLQDF